MIESVRVGVVLVLACAVTAGCGRSAAIQKASLNFMERDPSLTARRDKEAQKLIDLGVFVENMSPDSVKRLLGAPTFVHRGAAGGEVNDIKSDLQYVYRIDGHVSLRADFVGGQLKRLRRQYTLPDTLDHGMKEVELRPAE